MTLRTLTFATSGEAARALSYSEEADSFGADGVGLGVTDTRREFDLIRQWIRESHATRVTRATLANNWLALVKTDLPATSKFHDDVYRLQAFVTDALA